MNVFLTGLTLLAAGNPLFAPDLGKAKMRVREKVEYYTKATSNIAMAMQADTLFEKQNKHILEWIWPESKEYIRTKGHDVGESGHWILKSTEYTNWVGPGPPVLICTGQRTFLHETQLTLI